MLLFTVFSGYLLKEQYFCLLNGNLFTFRQIFKETWLELKDVSRRLPFWRRSAYQERGQTGCRRRRALQRSRQKLLNWNEKKKQNKKAVSGEHTVSAREGPGKKKTKKGKMCQAEAASACLHRKFHTWANKRRSYPVQSQRNAENVAQKHTMLMLGLTNWWTMDTCAESSVGRSQWPHSAAQCSNLNRKRAVQQGIITTNEDVHLCAASLSVFIMFALWRGWSGSSSRVPEENISQWAGQEEMAA